MSNTKARGAVNFSTDVGVRHTDSSATFVSPQTSRTTSRDDLAMSRSYDDLRQASKSDADASSDHGMVEVTEVVRRTWWERTSGPALSALKTRFRNRSPEIAIDDDDEDLTAGEDLSQARSRGRSFSVGSEPGHVSPQAIRCQASSRTLSPPRQRHLAASAVLGRLRRTTAHVSASVSEHVAQEVLGHLRRTTRTMSESVANRVANQVSGQVSNPAAVAAANHLAIGEEWSDCDETELQTHSEQNTENTRESMTQNHSHPHHQQQSSQKIRPRSGSFLGNDSHHLDDAVQSSHNPKQSCGNGNSSNDSSHLFPAAAAGAKGETLLERSRNGSWDSSSRAEGSNEVPVSSRWSIFSSSTATGSPLLEKKAGPPTPPQAPVKAAPSPCPDIPDEPLPARPSRWTRFFGASGTSTTGGTGVAAAAATVVASAPATVSSAASATSAEAATATATGTATGTGTTATGDAAATAAASGGTTTGSSIGAASASDAPPGASVGAVENVATDTKVAPDEAMTGRSSWWTWRSRPEAGKSQSHNQSSGEAEALGGSAQGNNNTGPAAATGTAAPAPAPAAGPTIAASSSSSSTSSWWSWVWSSSETPAERRVQASTTKAGTGIRSVIGSVEWLYADATQIVDSMIPSSREVFSQQEFEWADLMEAGAKISDLSVYLSSLPTWFWIFVIVLVYNIVFIAESVMEMWMDAVIFHFGIPAVCLLMVTVCMTWPVFIWYLIQTFSYAREVLNWHTRVVLMFGVPNACGSLEDMAAFCKAQKLNVEKIIKPQEDKQRQSETCNIELVFPSVEELQRAFKEELLTPHLKLEGVKVRVRPKLSMNAAMVEWWIVAFKHLNESVPERYWLRATLSCLITMSLMKHLTAGIVWLWVFGQNLLGILGWLLTKFAMCISLLSMLFFVGYHAFEEIRDAQKEIHNDKVAHRTTGFTSPDPPDVMNLTTGE